MADKKKNKNLHKAKKDKNDEFYTMYEDVENELKHYEDHFRGKIVYCNADGDSSAFVRYFKANKERLGIVEFYYSSDDFRSTKNRFLMARADVVVTNPPFSLFREYIAQLMAYGKKFLIVGSKNAITYKEIFPLIKDNKLWLGTMMPLKFVQPDGSEKAVPTYWYTNLKHNKRNDVIKLFKKYKAEDYPKYDNYDAINVDKVVDIPADYAEAIGVPISFLVRYNPGQFEICDANDLTTTVNKKPHALIKDKDGAIDGKAKYARIVIKKIKLTKDEDKIDNGKD